MKERAPRNRTMILTDEDEIKYSKNLVSLSENAEIGYVLNKTVNQDLFEAAPFLPAGFVDLLIADPPYNLNKSFGSGNDFKKIGFDEYENFTRRWLSAIRHTLKPDATVYICSDWESSVIVHKVLSEFFVVRNRITWEREKGRGAKANWKNCSEDIWFCTASSDYFFNADAVRLKRRVVAPYKENGRARRKLSPDGAVKPLDGHQHSLLVNAGKYKSSDAKAGKINRQTDFSQLRSGRCRFRSLRRKRHHACHG